MFNPVEGETFDDAVEFASVRNTNANSYITCGSSSSMTSGFICVIGPHGIQMDTQLSVATLTGFKTSACASAWGTTPELSK